MKGYVPDQVVITSASLFMSGFCIAMDYTFKTATVEQKQEIFDLYSLVMKGLIEKIWGWNVEWQEKDFLSYFEARNITVACEDEKIVGYLQTENRGQSIFVRMLLVHPKHQEKGIASDLMNQLFRQASYNLRTISLEVFKVNSRAVKFYRRFGFEVKGETIHSLIMEKSLQGELN